jgi:two-component system, response regulator
VHSRPLLLVEDNHDDAELTVRCLRQCHFASDIIVASDGHEALAFLHTNPQPIAPCVVLLDLKLPKLDGLSVLKRIREHSLTRTLPVVAFTASAADSDVTASYDLGANSFVRKPVTMDDFTRLAVQLGWYWTIANFMPV